VENCLSVTKTKNANFGHPKIVFVKNVGANFQLIVLPIINVAIYQQERSCSLLENQMSNMWKNVELHKRNLYY